MIIVICYAAPQVDGWIVFFVRGVVIMVESPIFTNLMDTIILRGNFINNQSGLHMCLFYLYFTWVAYQMPEFFYYLIFLA